MYVKLQSVKAVVVWPLRWGSARQGPVWLGAVGHGEARCVVVRFGYS